MTQKLNIPYPIIVEGRYDKQRLQCVMDGQIITTDGFGVFNHKEKLTLIRALAQKSPIIVLTDSDGAGKLIRSHITGAVPKDRLIQLYIPQIKGKEKRKAAPSAEGTLGVEGMEQQLLYDLLKPYEDDTVFLRSKENPLSKTDFYIDGLTGTENSTARRDEIAKRVGLPAGMTSNALLAALRLLCTYEEYLALVGRTQNS
jgi:ribonuclease M5